MKNLFPWIVFVAAALLEISGDALIRKGLRSSGLLFIAIGIVALGCYGLIVNSLKWDFSKLMGVYIAVFALISILFGRFVFKESIQSSTWVGLVVIVLGGLIIQFGQR
jgi:drug/metabolite transporter superfamily protein YnfA